MGGVATFSGTTYQERVIAYLAVHVLSQRQLQWFETEDDTPQSLSGETGGPGDDCAVALRGLPAGIEVQAKHGLTAGVALKQAVGEIIERLRKGGPSLRVVIAVDRSRTGTVLQVGDDLRRVRSGRTDRLKAETSALFGLAVDAQDLLARVSIICVDVDKDEASHAKEALVHLGTVLEDPSQAAAAWQVLIADAGTLSARRWSRLRHNLVGILQKNGIRVKPIAAEEHRRLDDCRDLLRAFHVSVAKERLAALEASLSPAARKDPEIQVRLLVLKANCDMRTGVYDSATTLARRALDVKQDDLDALRVGGFSRLYAGDIGEAIVFAERAIVAAPRDPKAWVLKAQVDAEAGVSPVTPPEPVERSAEYRTVRAKIARDREEWASVLDVTAELLRTGERDPDVLLLRAEALVAPGPPLAGSVVRDATELCGEVLEQVRNDDDPRVRRALELRSSILSDAGDKAGAEADQARLRDIAGADPGVLQNAAGIRARSGDAKGAIRVLEHHSVEAHPLLLAFRAQLKKDCGDDEGAKNDVGVALALLNDKTPSETKVTVAETLLLLGRKEDCLLLLADPVVANAPDPVRHVLVGRIAFLEGRIEDAIQAFQSGAEINKSAQRTILFELADRLRKAGRVSDAVGVLREFEDQVLPDREFLLLVQCLYEASRLVDTQRLIERRAATASLPPAAGVLSRGREAAHALSATRAALGSVQEGRAAGDSVARPAALVRVPAGLGGRAVAAGAGLARSQHDGDDDAVLASRSRTWRGADRALENPAAVANTWQRLGRGTETVSNTNS